MRMRRGSAIATAAAAAYRYERRLMLGGCRLCQTRREDPSTRWLDGRLSSRWLQPRAGPDVFRLRRLRLLQLMQLTVVILVAVSCRTADASSHPGVLTASAEHELYYGGERVQCPFYIHNVQQPETYRQARERCSKAGGSLPLRDFTHIACLARFFRDVAETSLAISFSGSEKRGLKQFLDETTLLWFQDDDLRKQHRKESTGGEKRQVACIVPAPARPGNCNWSTIVHYEALTFSGAQEACQQSYARLPFHNAKDEVQCFKDYFPDLQLTWFEGRRPDIFEPLSGERCFLNSSASNEELCPDHLRFICVSMRFQPDIAAKPIAFSNTAQLAVASIESFSNRKTSSSSSSRVWTDKSRQSRVVAIASEGARTSHENLDDPSVAADAVAARLSHLNKDSIRGPDGERIVFSATGSTDRALNCFNLSGPEMKVLDVGHSKDFYLKVVNSLLASPAVAARWEAQHDPKEMAMWAMPRLSKNYTACPVVIVNADRREVTKETASCDLERVIICEPRRCPHIREEYPSFSIRWPRALPGRVSFRSCASIRPGFSGNMSKKCSTLGYWEPSQNISCQPTETAVFRNRIFNLDGFDRKSDFIRYQLEAHQGALNMVFRTRKELAQNLIASIRGPQDAEEKTKKFMYEVMQTAVGRIVSKEDLSQACLIGRQFLTSFAQKLNDNQTVTSDGDNHTDSAYQTDNFTFAVKKVSLVMLNTSGEVVRPSAPRELLSEVGGSRVEVSGDFDTSQLSIVMGHIVLDKLPIQAVTPNASEPWADAMVNTPVVEFFLADGATQEPLSLNGSRVRISFRHFRAKRVRDHVKCVFYDIEKLVYSDYGCMYESGSSSALTTVCLCNHTTSFAALLLPFDFVLSHAQTKFLEYMTFIAMPFSMLSLVVCILIFTFIRQQHEQRNTIHRNLCISLLLGNIVLLLASYRSYESQGCALSGALVHLAYLSSLCWMALEGVHIIHVMWIVFVRSNIPTALYYVVGYLVPLSVVAATYWSFDSAYKRTAQLCFLSRGNLAILTFIVPIVVVVAVNFIAILVVFYRMRTVKSGRDEDLVLSACKWARGVAVLVPLLGLPWLIGLFMYSAEPSVVLGAAIAFNVFVALQGPGIFLCQVWFNNKKRDSIAKYLGNKGRLCRLIARVFVRAREAHDSSTKSSKVMSKSSTTVKVGSLGGAVSSGSYSSTSRAVSSRRLTTTTTAVASAPLAPAAAAAATQSAPPRLPDDVVSPRPWV